MLCNADKGDYLYCKTNDHRIYHQSLANLDDGCLWWFEASGDGVKIGNKAAVGSSSSYYGKQGTYLLNTTYSGGYGNFDGTGSTWYIERTPYNAVGLTVHNGSGSYWKRGSGSTGYVTPETFSVSDKDLHTWIIRSYDDLLEEARVNGADVSAYENADQTSAANFKALINLAASAKSAAITPVIADGQYVLINRRHNLFLDGDGTALKGVGSPTQDAVWQFTTIGGVTTMINVTQDLSVRQTVNAGSAFSPTPTVAYSLDAGVSQAMPVTFTKSSDGDVRFVTIANVVPNYRGSNYNFYFALETPDGTINPRSTQGFSSDWQFITVQDYLEELGLWEQGVTSAPTFVTDASEIREDIFYRLQNVARSYNYYDEDYPGYGGWLEDVDHQHIRADLGNTNATLAEVQAAAGSSEFYCADKDMSHASALWQFIIVSHATLGSEEATGVLATEHDIYVLRNANTGKYIAKGFNVVDGKSFHRITAVKSEAQPFYLQELADGEFALWEYSSTDSEGYDHNNGAMAIEGTAAGYRAGLTRTTTATANSNSVWHIQEAPTIRLNFVIAANNTVGDYFTNSEDYWTTFYYPFDAMPKAADAENIEIYAGAWIKDDVQIAMVRMNDVPAGNAVMLRSPVGGHYMLDIYPAGSGNCTQTDDDFEGSCWRGIVESEGNQYNGKPARYDSEWRNYWILGANKNHDVRLLHPAGDWLLPNRAYLDAVTTQSTPSNISMFVYFFDDRVTSVREALELIDGQHEGINTDNILYDLQGRPVSGTPQRGVYVRGGKKVFIR